MSCCKLSSKLNASFGLLLGEAGPDEPCVHGFLLACLLPLLQVCSGQTKLSSARVDVVGLPLRARCCSSEECTSLAPLIRAFFAHTAMARYNGSAVDIFDASTGSWSSSLSLSHSRMLPGCAAVGNIAVIAGGLYVSIPSVTDRNQRLFTGCRR